MNVLAGGSCGEAGDRRLSQRQPSVVAGDLAMKEERFAKGGKLLKTTEVKSVKRIQNRWVADLVIFKDALKQGRGTEFTLDSIDFEANIPETIFTKASLRK